MDWVQIFIMLYFVILLKIADYFFFKRITTTEIIRKDVNPNLHEFNKMIINHFNKGMFFKTEPINSTRRDRKMKIKHITIEQAESIADKAGLEVILLMIDNRQNEATIICELDEQYIHEIKISDKSGSLEVSYWKVKSKYNGIKESDYPGDEVHGAVYSEIKKILSLQL